MTTIKQGYNGQDLELRFSSRVGCTTAELWVEFKYSSSTFKSETLNYVSLEEMIKLRDEINKTIKEMVGL